MSFDRATEDVGNIVLLEHVNLTQPDQGPTTLFYIVALGGTRAETYRETLRSIEQGH